MILQHCRRSYAIAAVTCTFAVQAQAGVTEFSDRAEWEAAVGQFTTIDFTGFPEFTIITDQYQDSGVLFTDGNDSIVFNEGSFLNDGVGLRGGLFDDIELSFSTPQGWIGVDFPGGVRVLLFSGGELIHFSSIFSAGPDGVGGFGGLVSTELFDAVVILDPFDDLVFIDDLHFGVPAPGGLMLLALAGIWPRRRRRSRA